MPYIKDENNRRQELRDNASAKTAGELNFQIFSYLRSHLNQDESLYTFKTDYDPLQIFDYVSNFLGMTPNYQKYNDMIGCLTCCYNEFYRRFQIKVKYLLNIIDLYNVEIAKYEDLKIKENGDV